MQGVLLLAAASVLPLQQAPGVSPPSTHRFVVLFNPLEQERLSVVSLLVNSPRVRVLSEEGQPLSVQISAHWSSATNMVPDVYQVRRGSALPTCQYLSWGLTPQEHLLPTPLLCSAYPPGWRQVAWGETLPEG